KDGQSNATLSITCNLYFLILPAEARAFFCACHRGAFPAAHKAALIFHGNYRVEPKAQRQ
ncbi:hypothetical protein SNC70_02660, partial [Escherichia coli]|nr:hypothetical protein [Escherichia coli]